MIAMRLRLTVLAAASAAMLAACGGGGGDGDSADSGAAPAPNLNAGPIQTAIAPASYTGALAQTYQYLNESLVNCGFGAVKQSAQLDAAASNHARYVTQNYYGYYPHIEAPGAPGFTGIQLWDRAAAAGYQGTASGEVSAHPMFAYNTQVYPSFDVSRIERLIPKGTMQDLLNAPYHGLATLGGHQEVGIGFYSKWNSASLREGLMSFVTVFGKANPDGQQPADPDAVRTYPCEGSSGVGYVLTGEFVPNGDLTPGRVLGENPMGTTLYAIGTPGSSIRIQSASVIEVGSGAPVAIYQIRNYDNDPNPQVHPGDHMAYVLLDKPLKPSQRYQVTLSGLVNGKPFARTFTYTTSAMAENGTEIHRLFEVN